MQGRASGLLYEYEGIGSVTHAPCTTLWTESESFSCLTLEPSSFLVDRWRWDDTTIWQVSRKISFPAHENYYCIYIIVSPEMQLFIVVEHVGFWFSNQFALGCYGRNNPVALSKHRQQVSMLRRFLPNNRRFRYILFPSIPKPNAIGL